MIYSVDEILKKAFWAEAQRVDPQSNYEEFTAKGHGDSPHERIADGIMLKNTCLKPLGVRGKTVIIAYYTYAIEPELVARKQEKLETLVKWLQSEGDRSLTTKPYWYLMDIAYQWCAERPVHTDEWWAKHLSKSPNTLKRWRDKSLDILNTWKAQSEVKIEQYLENIELIEENT